MELQRNVDQSTNFNQTVNKERCMVMFSSISKDLAFNFICR